MISFLDALKHGLISKVVSEDLLDDEVNKIANKICDTSQPVIAMGKACFYSQVAQSRDEAYRYVYHPYHFTTLPPLYPPSALIPSHLLTPPLLPLNHFSLTLPFTPVTSHIHSPSPTFHLHLTPFSPYPLSLIS